MNFIIKFDMCRGGKWEKGLKIRVKNKYTDLQAKIGLERYLRKKYKDFCGLVIHSCDTDISDMFSKIWKK